MGRNNDKRNKIPIYYYEDENKEIMHGVGLHYSSHSISGSSKKGKETLIEGACPVAVQAALKQMSVPISPARNDLQQEMVKKVSHNITIYHNNIIYIYIYMYVYIYAAIYIFDSIYII